MKILMINVVCGIRSTGRICTDLATELEKRGHTVKIAYGRENVPAQFQKYAVRIGSDFDVRLHGLKARLFDSTGFGSKRATEQFIEWIKEYNPDVIHLHNLHGYYINIEVLFSYLKKCNKKIIWTLHDCWPFTGHCAYFDFIGCEKWESACEKCSQKLAYPTSIGLDMSKQHFKVKKELFQDVPNMILVTPSQWLANLVSRSFMKDYQLKVIYNGVDTSVFKRGNSNIKEKYNCIDKRIILGVASAWDNRKGLDTFVELSKNLDNTYQIILVGLTSKQIKKLPKNIIAIERTNNVHELSELYSGAYVFVNPTLEDNYPTTNLEAIACGTPVITFDTGGSPESAKLYGRVVPKGNISELIKTIETIDELQPQEINVDYREMVSAYIKLYEDCK